MGGNALEIMPTGRRTVPLPTSKTIHASEAIRIGVPDTVTADVTRWRHG